MKARVGNVLSGLLAAAAMCASMHCGAFELTHRWSFNGDYADSIGGSDGVVVGRADQLSFEASAFGGQMVKMASDNTDNDSNSWAALLYLPRLNISKAALYFKSASLLDRMDS